ncbi:C-type lectin domain family 2 member E [Cricetulus griseus]|uniref:C-type lectin domain family 2 member E n=1 Tax=Cricetulus griseus TaxID=10029 RepID=G3ILY3_CRIGR|nr:C-type lectin domain family 2 member E [Cricetulus griseus]
MRTVKTNMVGKVRKEKLANVSPGPCYATCPRDWIGFGSKCFYFSEDTRNWTSSQSSCIAREAHLALFESLEELAFTRYISLARGAGATSGGSIEIEKKEDPARLPSEAGQQIRTYEGELEMGTSASKAVLIEQLVELLKKQGKKLQGKCLRIIFSVSDVKLYCCYVVIMVLTVAVIALTVAMSLLALQLLELLIPPGPLSESWDFPVAASLQLSPAATCIWPQTPWVAGLKMLLELAARCHQLTLSFKKAMCPHFPSPCYFFT